MDSNGFEFNGDWQYTIELPLLAGLQERQGAYTSVSSGNRSTGLFQLEFEDDLSDLPDPYPEQLNTLRFIYKNQAVILKSIIEKTLSELPAVLVDYGLEDEEKYQHLDAEKVKSIIGISAIYIRIISKEGYSYFDIQGGCNWDEEHGLNLLFHKDRVISFGGIDGGSNHSAEKDGGAYNSGHLLATENKKPRKYLPHPKYNKLKPLQQSANETYEYTLISRGYIEQFKAGVESGEIDANGKSKSQDITYLEAACRFRNRELATYLLDRNAELRYALHQVAGSGDCREITQMLISKGADINSKNKWGNTVLYEVVNSMEGIYRANDFYRSINRLDLITDQNLDQLAESKKTIVYLMSIGADPHIKNRNGFDCFDVMRSASENSKKEVNEFLTMCWEERQR